MACCHRRSTWSRSRSGRMVNESGSSYRRGAHLLASLKSLIEGLQAAYGDCLLYTTPATLKRLAPLPDWLAADPAVDRPLHLRSPTAHRTFQELVVLAILGCG